MKKQIIKTDEEKTVDSVMKKLQKKYGDDIAVMGHVNDDFKVEFIPTGSFKLDKILGGGWPSKRAVLPPLLRSLLWLLVCHPNLQPPRVLPPVLLCLLWHPALVRLQQPPQ